MSVSIIIPTRNNAALLQRCLRALVGVAPPGGSEIIVVDNGSTDDTHAVFLAAREENPRHEWRYFHDPVPGLLTGRHRGAREAVGDVLAYLDDDVLVAPTWWEGITDAFADRGTVLVGGPSLPQFESPPPSWLGEIWSETAGGRRCGQLSLIDQGPEPKPCDPADVWGLNYAIRSVTLRECGGFHPDCLPKPLQRYQGDGETGLSLAIRRRGLRAFYHPAATVRHILPANRLKPEAFVARGFYQGVCDSYTQLRDAKPEARSRIRSVLHTLLSKRPSHFGRLGVEAREVLARHEKACREGFAWHRREARADKNLLEWIRRDNYFDYKLPDGAERWMSPQGDLSAGGREW